MIQGPLSDSAKTVKDLSGFIKVKVWISHAFLHGTTKSMLISYKSQWDRYGFLI
jgi:hypothetical protein